MGWLAYEPHGDLWSIVLTQRIVKGEALGTCKNRMARKQRMFMRWCTRIGMDAAMTTTHVVVGQGSGGWHYHVHCLLDVPAGLTSVSGLWDKWREISDGEPPESPGEAVRLVRAAGSSIVALREDGGDPEFWKESRDVSARAVQYPMRDLAQGISASRLGGDPLRMEAAAHELVTTACGWKLFRAWGKWRKACPAALAAEKGAKEGEDATAADEGEKKKAAPGPAKEPLGTVRAVWFRARRGEIAARLILQEFERTVSNSSEFAKRFVRWCRLGWDPGGA